MTRADRRGHARPTSSGGEGAPPSAAAAAGGGSSVESGVGWSARESAKRAFQKKTGFPNGRDGYVVDYIVPLKDGGTDSPDNLQWLTLDQARARAGVN